MNSPPVRLFPPMSTANSMSPKQPVQFLSEQAAAANKASLRKSNTMMRGMPLKQVDECIADIRMEDVDSSSDSSPHSSSLLLPAESSSFSSACYCPSLPPPAPHPTRPSINILHQLHARQARTVGITHQVFKKNTYAHRFGRFRLQRSTPVLDGSSPTELELLNQQKSSKISEIVSAGDFVFALTHAGVCVAFDRRNFSRLCYLNVISDEVIRSLFYNKANRSLITVSVYRHDNFTSLRCRSTSFDAIAAGKPELGVSLFMSESLQWPGFVEFDDVNKKVLTFSALTKKYKVWDLANYNLLYDIDNPNIEEVKVSPGIMLLICKREKTHVPLKIVSIETGEVLQEFEQPLERKSKIEFIEQFNEKLLVKQRRQPLHMVDVQDDHHATMILPESQFPTPSAFIFLYENEFFLTFNRREISVWNFDGNRVANFEDHLNYYPDCNTNNIYINTDQDIIISYCLTPKQVDAIKRRDTHPMDWRLAKEKSGSINISNIFTGSSIAKIERKKLLKYPFEMLSKDQQRQVLRNRYLRPSSVGIDVQSLPHVPLPGDAAEGIRAQAIEERERQLTILLEQTQQQRSTLRQTTIADPSSPTPAAASAFTDILLESMLSEDQFNSSDDEDDEDEEANEGELTEDSEDFSHVNALKRVAFSANRHQLSQSSLGASTLPPHHLPNQEELKFKDLSAYRTYNNQVKRHNAALRGITAVSYNEERNEIYTGNRLGNLHVWSH